MLRSIITLLYLFCLLCILPFTLHAQTAIQYDASGNITNEIPVSAGAPTITAPPINQFVLVGDGAAISVLASGPGSLSYQWLSNGIPILGATNDTLYLPGLTTSSGGFSVMICNGSGCVTSSIPMNVVVATPRIWTGSSDTNWSNPLNWFPTGIPGPNDILTIAGGTINLTASVSFAGQLNWSGGTISGKPLTISSGGTMNWSGGAMNGPLTVAASGVLNISGAGLKYLQNALTNAGTVNWSGIGSLLVENSSQTTYVGRIENQAGALWDMQSDSTMMNDYAAGSPYFRNLGTLRKSVGFTSAISIPLNNSGTVSVLQGSLFLGNGGTINGSFNAAAGTSIIFSGGSFTYSTLPALTGSGSFQLAGATLTLLNDVISNLQMISGTVNLGPNFQGGSITNLTLNGVTLNGTNRVSGVFNCGNGLTGSLQVLAGGIMNWSGGTITTNTAVTNGPVLTVAGGAVINWSGGTLSGPMTIASSGILNISGSNSKYVYNAINNAGTVNWTVSGGSFVVQNDTSSYRGAIYNLSGGLWDFQADQTISSGWGYEIFSNAGTVRKSAGTGTNTVQVAFSNSGTVAALSGALSFSGSFTPGAGTLRFGLSSLSSFGRINLAGSATLGGTVGATLLNGFTPALYNTFPVLTYGSSTGVFTNTDLPPSAGWLLNYGATTFSLQVFDTNMPRIVSQPQSTTNFLGTTANFTVTATGTPPLFYQWQFNGTNLADNGRVIGSQSNTLTLTNLLLSDTGNYQVIVSNAFGSLASSNATLTVQPPWTMTNGLALWLDASQLTGLADGQQVATWTDMSGQTNHALRQSSSSAGYPQYKAGQLNGKPVLRFNSGSVNTGDYFKFNRISTIRTVFWVLKENTNAADWHFLLGDDTSYDFSRASANGPLWSATYANANVRNGTTKLMGSVVNGTSTALPPSQFQLVSLVTAGNVQANQITQDRTSHGSWQGDMAEILVYTTALSSNQEAVVGSYLANKYGLTTAYPTVTPEPPYIVAQPVGQTNAEGGTVTFNVIATGAPLSYQWQFNGLPLTNDARITGSQSNTLTIASLLLGDAGSYQVIVTNTYGSATSSIAALGLNTCVSPPTGVVSWWRAENNPLDLVGTNLGTLRNGAVYAGGEVGQAFGFDGVSSDFVAPAGGLPVGNSDRTLELWVKADAVVTTETFFAGYGNFGSANAVFEVYGFGGQIAFSQWGTSVSGGTLRVGQWQHIAATSQGGFVTLYVDGQRVASGSQSINTPSGSQFYLGRAPGTYGDTRKLQGEVDEVTVYNRALTSNEVAAVYLAGNAGKCLGPQPPSITAQPQSTANLAGGTAAFTVTANGTSPLSYQWQFNGTNLADNVRVAGSQGTNLAIANLLFSDAGSYRVIVTNSYGSATSTVAALAVTCPAIVLSPASMPGATPGTACSQTLSASGGAGSYSFAITIGSLPTGLTLATNGLLSGTPSAIGTSNFTVTATDTNGCTGSQAYMLAVLGVAPSITSQPQGITNLAGTTASFTVAAAGAAPLAYQWLFNGTNVVDDGRISGTSGNTLSIVNIQGADSGGYSVVVTNFFGSLTSSVAALSLLAPLWVEPFNYADGNLTTVSTNLWTAHSGSGINPVKVLGGKVSGLSSGGEDVNRALGATYSNGVLYAGFDLTLAPTNVSGSGYFLHFKDASSLFKGRVFLGAPTVAGFRLGLENDALDGGATVLFTGDLSFGITNRVILAYDVAARTSRLWVNSTNELAPTLEDTNAATFSSVSALALRQGSGVYGGLSIDNIAVATSFAWFTATTPSGSTPQITVQPQSRTDVVGATATFTVGASGTAPLSYQWQFGGTNLANNSHINGAGSTSLIVSNLLVGDAGNYWVIVTNSSGSATSSVASLTVLNATPVITWANPADVGYGTALSSAQLNATASVPGAFAYTPVIGTVLNAGTNTLSVMFTPTDTANYNSATSQVALVVAKAPLTVAANSTNRPYGQTNPGFTGMITGLTNSDPITASYNCTVNPASPPGTYVIVPSLNDPSGRLGNYALTSSNGTFAVTCAAIVLSPSTLPTGTNGVAYSQTITASGGAAPYTFSLAAGNLPPGVTLTTNGLLSGMPTATGTNNFTVTSADSNGCGGSQAYALTIVAPTTNQVSQVVYAWTNFVGQPGGYGNADGTGSSARFYNPWGVAVDSAGNVYVADQYNYTIRKVTPAGVVTTLAGTALNQGSADGTGSAARFYSPSGVAVDSAGNVYVADSSIHTIRKVTPAGVVTTLAGSAGIWGSADGTGSAARFYFPSSLAVDSTGNVYVADRGYGTLRKVTSGGVVTTLAGSAGPYSWGSADGTGSAASFYSPSGVVVDSAGNVYVADNGNHTIRKVTPAGVVTTLAGSAGTWGSADGTGSAARFYNPTGVAVDSAGNVFVADQNNHTIRKVSSDGVVTTIGGSPGVIGGNDGIGSSASFTSPVGVAMDNAGNLYMSDYANNNIFKGTPILLSNSPVITSLTGSGTNGVGSLIHLVVSATGSEPLAYQWLFNGMNLNDSGSISGSQSNTLTLANLVMGNGGNYQVVVSNAYGVVTSAVLVVAVTPASPAIIWTNPASISYGTLLSGSQLNATANVPGTFAHAPAGGTALTAGTNLLSAIFTPTDTANYYTVTSSVSLVVLRAPLTVVVNSTNRPYGQTNPVFTGTIIGVTNSDPITASYNCSATPSSPPSGYAIVPSLNDSNGRLGNYAVTSSNGTLTVTCATITLSPSTLPTGMSGAIYSQSLSASGGAGPYNFAVTLGNLPAGLALATNGLLGGTPTTTGTNTFTVTATDTNGCSGSQAYSLALNTAVVAIGAIPYASGITNSAGIIQFILNDIADDVTVVFDNSTVTNALGALAKGLHSFALGAHTNYAIRVARSTPPGWSQTSADTNQFCEYPSPRGVAVNKSPADLWRFGRIYVSDSLSGGTISNSVTQLTRTNSGKGIYLLNADLSDAIGRGFNASSTGISFNTPLSQSSPFRINLGEDGKLYVNCFGNVDATTWRSDPDCNQFELVLAGIGANANPSVHTDSASKPIAKGSTAGGSLVLYNLEGNAGSGHDNSLAKWSIGAGALPWNTGPVFPGAYSGFPTIPDITSDLEIGPDGKYYTLVRRTITDIGALKVWGSDGATLLWDATSVYNVSLNSPDPLMTSEALAISPDGKTLAIIRDDNAIMTLNLTNGIPDGNTLVTIIQTPTTALGRAISWDAAGNLYTVSSGQRLLRVFSPGGYTVATTRSDGTFSISRPSVLIWTNPAPIVYGTAINSNQLNAAATGNGTSLPGRFVYGPTNGTVLAAGTNSLTVVFSPADTNTYSSATMNVSLVVLPAPLTVAANNATRAYGQTNPAFTGTLTGLTNSDPITASYNCSATPSSPPGSYSIVPSLNDPSSRLGNYSVTSSNGTLTVACATIALSPATLPAGTMGLAYSQSLGASGGAGAYGFAVTVGSLPAGLTLATNGVLSGTPLATGTNDFTVTATDTHACSGSQAYALVVAGVAPSITSQPQSVTNPVGTAASFTVTAAGTAQLTYQWQFNGTNLSDGVRISGSQSNLLSIAGVLAGDAGSCRVIVTNAYGSATSSVASLTVTLPPGYNEVSFRLLDGGAVRLSFLGIGGADYVLERTFNLSPPPVWVPLATNRAAADGSLVFTNTPVPATNDFWRVRSASITPSAPAGMALIPAGSFTMGNCMDASEGASDELPLHTNYMSAFYMDKYDVTKSLWDAVEWERAARGGASGQRFPWGNTISWSQANYYAAPSSYAYDVNPTSGYNSVWTSGGEPTCYVEQLIYDCRLMNQALADGRDAALLYRKWMVNSDAFLDPQAYVLTPESAVTIAEAIVRATTPVEAGRVAALTGVRLIREAHRDGRLKLPPREVSWLDRIQKAAEAISASESEFSAEMMAEVDTTKFVAADYGL